MQTKKLVLFLIIITFMAQTPQVLACWQKPEPEPEPKPIVYKQRTVYLGTSTPFYWDGSQYRIIKPYVYRNTGNEPVTIHYTEKGYDRYYTVKPKWVLTIYALEP